MTNELRRLKAKYSIYHQSQDGPIFAFVRDVLEEALQKQISNEEFFNLLKTVRLTYAHRINDLSPEDLEQQKLFKDE